MFVMHACLVTDFPVQYRHDGVQPACVHGFGFDRNVVTIEVHHIHVIKGSRDTAPVSVIPDEVSDESGANPAVR